MTDINSLPKRRRLSDLYVVGKKEVLTDGENEIEVWVQKISPLDQRNSMDMAHAARAKVIASKAAPDDDNLRVSVTAEAEWDGFTAERDEMIEFLSLSDLSKSRASHEAEVASLDEWSKNEYYSGLREAWDSEMNERFDANPEDEEAGQIFRELTRYMKEVDRLVEKDRKSFVRGYATVSDEELKRKVIDGLIETQGDQVWVTEFRKAQLFFALRDPDDHSQHYLDDPDEIDVFDVRVTKQLFDAFDAIMVDPSEGKE
jgi:hypothetical protein